MTLEEFLDKIGLDRIAHFSIAGFVTALFTIVALLQEGGDITPMCIAYPLIGAIPVILFAWFKEAAIDYKFDKYDFIASILGCVPVFLATLIGYLLHSGFN